MEQNRKTMKLFFDYIQVQKLIKNEKQLKTNYSLVIFLKFNIQSFQLQMHGLKD